MKNKYYLMLSSSMALLALLNQGSVSAQEAEVVAEDTAVSSLIESDTENSLVESPPNSMESLTVTNQVTEVVEAKKPTFTKYMPVLKGEETVVEPLTFTLNDKQSSTSVTSSEGEVALKLTVNNEYELTLDENDKYEMDTISFDFKNDGGFIDAYTKESNDLITSINVKEKAARPEYSKLTLLVMKDGDLVQDPVQFNLKNADSSQQLTNDGGWLDMKAYHHTPYLLSLKENEKYEMDPITFEIKEGDNGLRPYNLADGSLLMDVVLKDKSQQTFTTLYLPVMMNDERLNVPLSFEVVGNNSQDLVTSNGGEIKLRLLNNTDYTVSLVENADYQMEDKTFAINDSAGSLHPYESNGNLLTKLTVTPTNSTDTENNPEENQERIVTLLPMKIVDSETKEDIAQPLTFDIFNVSKQAPYKSVTTVEGKMPAIELVADNVYTVTLAENPHYKMMRRQITSFLDHYPIDFNDPYGRYFTEYEVTKKQTPEEPSNISERVDVSIPVVLGNDLYTEPMEFELKSPFETLNIKVNDGMLSAQLYEDIDYMIKLVGNENYDVEKFPIVVKDKGIYGKHPYDHRNCNLVQNIPLVNKGDAEKNNNKLYCQTHDVIVSGMNFSDLKLDVNAVNVGDKFNDASKEYDAYSIDLINIYRNEFVKPFADFNVDMPVTSNKAVTSVYQVLDNGDVIEVPFCVEDNRVVTESNTLSVFVVEYGEKSVEVSTPEEEDVTKEETPEVTTPSEEKPTKEEAPKVETPADENPAKVDNSEEKKTADNLVADDNKSDGNQIVNDKKVNIPKAGQSPQINTNDREKPSQDDANLNKQEEISSQTNDNEFENWIPIELSNNTTAYAQKLSAGKIIIKYAGSDAEAQAAASKVLASDSVYRKVSDAMDTFLI